MLKYIIGGAVLVLAALGGFINYNRERSGLCSQDWVADYLHPELIKEYEKESDYLADLRASITDDRVSAADKAANQKVIDAVEAQMADVANVVSREVSPSNRLKKTCVTRLEMDNGYAQARYQLSTEPMDGATFNERFSKRRKNIILRQDLEAGKTYDTVEVAVVGRRSFDVNEKPFPGVSYALTFTPETAVSAGIVSDIPK